MISKNEKKMLCYSITVDDTNHDFHDIFCSGKNRYFFRKRFISRCIEKQCGMRAKSCNKSSLRVKHVFLSPPKIKTFYRPPCDIEKIEN